MVDQPTSSDRAILTVASDLSELVKHPLWVTYQRDVLDASLQEVQDLILNGLPGPPRPAVEEMACLKALRLVAKTLTVMSQEPARLLRLARDMQEQFNLLEGSEEPGE